MLYELPIVNFEDPTVYVKSRNLSEKVLKTVKPMAFLVAFQVILTFSEAGHENQKETMMSEKWGRQQTKWYMQKVAFYDEDYVYQISKLQPM